MKVLGISGSLRKASFNTALLREAAALAPDGVTVEIVDISGLPLYDGDVEAAGMPPAVDAFKAAIRAADALLISTPEYNYSFSGVLKNAIDWASRPPEQPFDDKPIAILGASAGKLGTARAQYHLRQVFIFLNGRILNKPEVMVGGAGAAFDDAGRLTDETARELIGLQMAALRDWATKING